MYNPSTTETVMDTPMWRAMKRLRKSRPHKIFFKLDPEIVKELFDALHKDLMTIPTPEQAKRRYIANMTP